METILFVLQYSKCSNFFFLLIQWILQNIMVILQSNNQYVLINRL